jgi:hypothetical protein
VYRTLIFLLFLSGYASAHEWTPTYPELKYSHVPGILKIDMNLFNARTDVGFYEVSVWDADWNKVSFAAEMRVFPMDYLGRKSVTIYIKESDKDRVTYICSESKLQSDGNSQSSISSKVCSKIKR